MTAVEQVTRQALNTGLDQMRSGWTPAEILCCLTDAALLIEPTAGGQARINEDDYVEGAPELVAEVAASSVAVDLNAKFRAYQRNGVREYLVWRVEDRAIDWFALRGGRFERVQPDAQGVLRSDVFPGLWLNVTAILRDDMASVLKTLQLGLDTPEHAAFKARLSI